MQNSINTSKAFAGGTIFQDENFIPKLSSVLIEISGKCNANCPYCARRRFKQRYSGKNMHPILFEKILDHLLDIGILQRDLTPTINLFNWGEPFLNPELNSILKILKEKKLYAGISSNFIMKPDVDKDSLSVIRDVTFSLSGFSQESYGRIHGASFKKVLNHFDEFYQKIQNAASIKSINIAWHRYKFNELELWEAYKYFDRPGIRFSPTIAYFNDLIELLDYAGGRVAEDRLRQAEKDLFLDHIPPLLAHHKKKSKNYHCFMWEYLVIDEMGQLLLCCGMTNNDSDAILGNVLEMSAEEIWQKKLSDSICEKCIASGVPRAIDSIGNKPLPAGGGGNYLKLWSQLFLPCYAYPKVIRMIETLPGGEKMAPILRKIKNKIRENK